MESSTTEIQRIFERDNLRNISKVLNRNGIEKDTNGFVEMDVLDEKQISDELKGHVLETYFYEVQGKIGLSWAGIKAVAARYEAQGFPISVEHVEVTESPDGKTYRAIAVAKNLMTGAKRTGAAEQGKFWDPEGTKPREFAYTLAASKAQRNAIRHFLPETVIASALQEWKDKKQKLPSK